MTTQDFRVPGVLNSKQMLVAEAIQARAWMAISRDNEFSRSEEESARARLGGIVVRLMAGGSQSVGDLAAAAVVAFNTPAGR